MTDADDRNLTAPGEEEQAPAPQLADDIAQADADHGSPSATEPQTAEDATADSYTPYVPQQPRLSRKVVRGSRRRSQRMPFMLHSPMGMVLIFLLVVGGIFAWNWFTVPIENKVTGQSSTRWEQGVKLARNMVSPKASLKESFDGKQHLTILLIGLDHVPATKKDPGIIRRNDSTLVASTDFESGQIRLASLPRDGWIQHWQNGTNFGYEKLGHTYAYGQMYNQKKKQDLTEGGLTRARESVSKLLEMEIDHYVVIEFEGFIKLIDELGGLEVDVEKNMDWDDNAGDLHIHLKKGPQHLNGVEAMGYARFRHDAMGDKGRMQRQQKVIKLILEKMATPQMLPKLPQLAKLFNESVKTSLSLDQLLALAQHTEDYNLEEMESMSLPSYWAREPGHERNLPGVSAENQHLRTSDEYIAPSDVKKVAEFLADLNAPPRAVVRLNAEAGTVPFTATLDASKSSDRDGSVASYEVDWNGDGNFEDQSTEPQLSHDYTTAGEFTINVRVLDDKGKPSPVQKLQLILVAPSEQASGGQGGGTA
ncbi:LCP family protein [bacterium]|nr:LCP family protein [bacterium]